MTKKRYVKNPLKNSLERGCKNQGKKTNLFISSKVKLKRYQARVNGNTPGAPSPAQATPGAPSPAQANTPNDDWSGKIATKSNAQNKELENAIQMSGM